MSSNNWTQQSNIFNTGNPSSTQQGEEPMETEDYPSHPSFVMGPSTPAEIKPPDQDNKVDDDCAICLSDITNKTELPRCSHSFCRDCIEQQFKYKPSCPICGTVYGKIQGNQPAGSMYIQSDSRYHIKGYDQYGIIRVSYSFYDGIQGPEHPHPGQSYSGTNRIGYLPDCPQGRIVARLLKVAFDRRLVFTVGRSRTTGIDNCVTWNDIHHKTSIDGGPENFGYPDPTYLNRVLEELAAKGVTEADLDDTTLNIIHPSR